MVFATVIGTSMPKYSTAAVWTKGKGKQKAKQNCIEHSSTSSYSSIFDRQTADPWES
jgi:hypothetical protein